MVSINKIAEQAIAILNQIKYPSHLVSCHQQYFIFFLKKNIRRKCRTILGVREMCDRWVFWYGFHTCSFKVSSSKNVLRKTVVQCTVLEFQWLQADMCWNKVIWTIVWNRILVGLFHSCIILLRIFLASL